jgi:hypothetical protein
VQLVESHVTMHATYPLLGRTCKRELGSLNGASREKVIAVLRRFGFGRGLSVG